MNATQQIDNEIKNVCGVLWSDAADITSIDRLASAFAGGVAALLLDPGFVAYSKTAEIPVAENDFDGRASALRDAKAAWEFAVLFPAQAKLR